MVPSLAALALSCCGLAVPSPVGQSRATTDSLSKFGLAECRVIRAKVNRVVVPHAADVVFLGVWNISDKHAQPWGLDGKPASPSIAKLFWQSVDLDPKGGKPRHGARDGKTFAMGIASYGHARVGQPMDDILSPSSPVQFTNSPSSPDDDPMLEGYVIVPPGRSSSFAFRLEVVSGSPVEICRFGETASGLPEGFRVELLGKAENTMSRAEKGERKDFYVDNYAFAVTLPDPLRKMSLDLITTEWKPPSRVGGGTPDPFEAMFNHALALPGDGLGQNGKVLFHISVPRTGKPPMFVFRAAQRLLIEFPHIPRQPNR